MESAMHARVSCITQDPIQQEWKFLTRSLEADWILFEELRGWEEGQG